MSYLKQISTLLLFVFVFTGSVSNSFAAKSESEKIINDFFAAVNNSDFETVSKLINDDFVISEGDFIIANSKESFYIVFQWDSVFSPKSQVLDIVKNNNAFETTISKVCKRIKFLHDSEIKVKVRITIEDDLITKLETYDYPKFDTTKWQGRRGELIGWVNENHPDLSGFINDMTKKGAERYMKAIDLYQNHKQ